MLLEMTPSAAVSLLYLSCLPNAYAYSKIRKEHWQDQMDVILARLKETGFPQHHYYS